MSRNLNFEIKCKECGSESIEIEAVDNYKGSVILSFYCSDCSNKDTYGFAARVKEVVVKDVPIEDNSFDPYDAKYDFESPCYRCEDDNCNNCAVKGGVGNE